MRKLLVLLVIVLFFCQCSFHNNKTSFHDNEMDTLILNKQFIQIVKEYVESHSEYDSYLISSQFTIAKYLHREFKTDEPTKYYISPATYSYQVEITPDSSYTFFCFDGNYVATYFKINNKKIYISSDIDELSRNTIDKDSLPHKIVSKKTGGIWCFAIKEKKCIVVSKNVEKDHMYWSGVIMVKGNIKFD